MVNDQPFNVIENEGFQDMIKFIRPGIQIPSTSTLRRDLTKSYKTSKENFIKELQVSNLIVIIN